MAVALTTSWNTLKYRTTSFYSGQYQFNISVYLQAKYVLNGSTPRIVMRLFLQHDGPVSMTSTNKHYRVRKAYVDLPDPGDSGYNADSNIWSAGFGEYTLPGWDVYSDVAYNQHITIVSTYEVNFAGVSIELSEEVYVPTPSYTAPTGLTASSPYNITPYGATFDVSITSYGNPSLEAGRYIEAGILGSSTYGSPYRFRASHDVLSASITVDNSASTGSPALNIQPNTRYYYGGWASNTQRTASVVSGQFVTTAEGPTVSISQNLGTSFVLNYKLPADGGVYSRIVSYSIDNGTTWNVITTLNNGNAATGTFTVSGLTKGNVYTVLTKTSTTAGITNGTTVTLDTKIPPTFYGSANNVANRTDIMYGSVSDQATSLNKLYGSVNGVTKRIF